MLDRPEQHVSASAEALLNALPAAIYITDAEGRITFYNEAAAELWGVRPVLWESAWCGSWRLYWPDGTALPPDQCPMATALKEQRAISGACAVCERPDGTRVPFLAFPRPLYDRDGTFIGGINTLVDISPIKSAEQSLGRRAREQEALYRFTDNLYRASSLADIYAAGLDAILETLQGKAASILRFDQSGTMRFVASRGLSEAYRAAIDGHSPWQPDTRDPEPIFISNVEEASLPDEFRASIEAEGIRALAFIPLTSGGRVIGKFMTYYDAPRAFDRGAIDLAVTIARQLGFSLERAGADEERQQARDTLAASEKRLSQELDLTKQLHEISAAPIHEGDSASLYEKILDGAVNVMGSDFASMQIVSPERGPGGELRLIAFRGFDEQATKFWEWVGAGSQSTCAVALRTGQRVVCEDVRACDFMQDTDDLAIYLQSGVRAVQSTPLLSRSGQLLGVISTHWRRPHRPPLADLHRLDLLARQAADLIERANAASALRDRQERLRAVFDSPTVGVAVLTPDGHFIETNLAFSELSGFDAEELLSLNSLQLTHPDDRPAMRAELDGMLEGDRPGFVIEKRYIRKDGSVIWVQNSVSLTRDEAGRPLHLVKLIQDITGRKVAEKRQRLLIDEINHRVKNTLATVQSFASQSLRNASSLAEGRTAFEARLMALSKSHDVLTREHWEGADLIEVVNGAIAAYRGRAEQSRFRIEGERLRLRPKAVLALSMAFHELATNAVKYGALSKDSGKVSVSWRVVPQSGRFELRWRESGGPVVSPPARRGFGSRLIEYGLAQDIGGEVRLRFDDLGVICSISAPLNEITGPK